MIIHDHFDGSAHCVQCKGKCQFSGDELAVTQLVRWTFEFSDVAHNGWMWDFTRDALKKLLGKDYYHFAHRACSVGTKKP